MTDITQRGVQIIDDNARTVSTGGMVLTNTITFTGDATTVAVPLFHTTGTVLVLGIWGVVTTTLGNHTAAYFRLNDQTAQSVITKATGTTLTDILPGSSIAKKLLASSAVNLFDNAAGVVAEPAVSNEQFFSPFLVQKKTGAVTDIEYVYTTSDSPTTGAIQFFVNWIPVSNDGKLEIA